jgi:hypothetical protein
MRRWVRAGLASALMLWLGAAPNRAADDAAPYAFLSDELDPQFNFTAALQSNGGWTPQSEMRMAFNYKDASHHYFLSITRDGARFFKVSGSSAEKLGTPATFDLPSNGNVRFTLQRRAWRVALLWSGQVVAEAFDDEFSGGRLGVAVMQAPVNLTEPRYQPTEDAEFSDDFMRTASAMGGEWEPLLGKWNYSGLQDNRADPNRSPNPFTYRGLTDESGQALSAAGRWFWDGYSVSASVKPETSHAVGLCAYLQDRSNYLAFKWTTREKRLVRVVNGQETTLTTAPGGFVPKQWYRLEMRASGGRVVAVIDGQDVLSAHDRAFGQGKVGLLIAKSPEDRRANTAHFDDVKVKPWTTLVEDFSVASVGKWKDVGARWRTDAAKRQRVKVDAGAGLSVVGEKEWENYQVSATVNPPAPGAVGLCFGYQAADDYYLFTCPKSGSFQLIHQHKGERRVLANGMPSRSAPNPQQPQHLRVDVKDGYVRAFVDAALVLERYLPDLPPGKVGIYADGAPEIGFSDVRVSFDQVERGENKVPERFAKDALMQGWANAAGAWRSEDAPQFNDVPRYPTVRATRVAQGTFWHKGDFFADPVVSFPCPTFERGNRLAVLLYGNPDAPDAGYRFIISGDDAQTPRWELSVNGGVAQTARRSVTPGATLQFFARGSFVAASVNGTTVLSFQGAPQKRGTKIGLVIEGVSFDLSQVNTDTPHLLDYTFSSAPVDWWAQKGIWEVTERWTCGPQWSFFGGVGAVNPVLWSKSVLDGDLTVEIYAATPMDPARGERSPADINLTICGNGMDLSSGYSFIFAGARQRFNRLYRGDEVVVEKPFILMARNTHQGWFYIRVEKSGGRLRCFVDDNLMLEYDDPNPLPGGRVAFWSYDGGISLARVRLWYERLGKGTPLTEQWSTINGQWSMDSSPLTSQPLTLSSSDPTNDFENGLGSWTNKDRHDSVRLSLDNTTASRGQRSLKIQSVTSGGDFTVWATRMPFDAERFPVARFDYKVPDGVRVNLYAKVAGDWREIEFTAGREMLSSSPTRSVSPQAALLNDARFSNGITIGNVQKVIADGRWHSAEVNLLAAIRRANLNSTIVEELAFASPTDRYLRCGFGGNHFGATYHLDNFRLEAAK